MDLRFRLFTGILFIPMLIITTCADAQVVQQTGKITLPVPPSTSLVLTNGQNVTYRSWTEIEILPETDVQSGVEGLFEVMGLNTPPNNPAPNLNMNWTLSRGFDAGGNVINESKSFYDSKGLLLQSQIRNITTGQVLARQVINDQLGRPALNTLLAPILNAGFSYKNDFVNTSTGTVYTNANFDGGKLNTPDAVGNTTPGTLGWYYSNNNTLEPYTPVTGYPYARKDFYNDGTGELKRTTGAGEVFRMGQGHELKRYITPIHGQLDLYLNARTRYFLPAEVGEVPGSISQGAVQITDIDANGVQTITIQDKNGHVLETARPGTSGSYASKVTLSKSSYDYKMVMGYDIESSTVTLSGVSGTGNASIYVNSKGRQGPIPTLIYQGKLNAFVPGGTVYTGMLTIESDQPFTVQYSASNGLGAVSSCNGCAAPANTSGNGSVAYFVLTMPSAISVFGQATLLDMSTETPVSTSGTLPAGYYKLIANEDGVSMIYYSTFTDENYNFYNQLGQLVATVPPEGVKKLAATNYASKADIPFVSLYEYDIRGRRIAKVTADGGRTEFVYRADGRVRFSQNAGQRARSAYSYTSYDKFGRSLESGEFTPGTGGIAFNKAGMGIEELLGNDGGLGTGTRTDWEKTTYTTAVATGLTGYVQDNIFLPGHVTYSENLAGAKSWYNYDDQGRTVWLVQDLPGIGKKTIDYSYDGLNRVTKVVYQQGTPGETFVHYYEYDADSRLAAVYTNTTDNTATRTMEAKYYYYVHGPVKRVELGGNVQGIDYTYTIQGWLKAINQGNRNLDPGQDGISGVNAGFAKDAFGMTLEYYSGDYTQSQSNINSIPLAATVADDQYNGTIKGMSWSSRKPQSVIVAQGAAIENPTMFGFKYDTKYQLNSATWGTPDYSALTFTASTAFSEKGVTYDANGNILTLSRTDGTGATLDNFTYGYQANNNKLLTVGNSTASYGTYTYDVQGQTVSETPGTGAARYMKYDATGAVIGVYSDAALTLPKVTFAYNERGQRIMKKDWVNNVTTYYVPDAAGKVMSIYTQAGTGTIAQTEMPIYAGMKVGLYRRDAGLYEFELSDLQGNVRATIDQNRTIKQYSDYYPFGYVMREGGSLDYRYGYQGQFSEKDKETGWNAFELRMYNSRVGRWLSTDPQAQYSSLYVGMGNKGLNGVDKNGAWFWENMNVRQARLYAKTIGGIFDKWKGQDGRTYASVQLEDNDLDAGGGGVYTQIFRPGVSKWDLLFNMGAGYYASSLTEESGLHYIYFRVAIMGDAWASGQGEYDRHGQPPSFHKALIGALPITGIPNDIHIILYQEDLYGMEASSSLDQIFAYTGIITAPISGWRQWVFMGMSAGNDGGLYDGLKTQKSQQQTKY